MVSHQCRFFHGLQMIGLAECFAINQAAEWFIAGVGSLFENNSSPQVRKNEDLSFLISVDSLMDLQMIGLAECFLPAAKRQCQRLVSVKRKKKEKKVNFCFLLHCSFIICLVLNSNLTSKFCLQFLLAYFTCKFYL